MTMAPCKFTFDDETVYDGFAHGSTWNGFDNVAVTKEVLTKICDDFMLSVGDESGAEDFRDLTPMENGLYSLGWGFATSIVKDETADPHAICRKWVSRIGGGFHPDTRGKDYSPKLDAEEIKEYDRDMDALFEIAQDPYECAIAAMEDARVYP